MVLIYYDCQANLFPLGVALNITKTNIKYCVAVCCVVLQAHSLFDSP